MKPSIKATCVAHSSYIGGPSIATFELEYPRFIHAEFMTHRLFSRNAASSRAIPVAKLIEHVRENTAMPLHWGANQKGMQADNECNNRVWGFSREHAWLHARDRAIEMAEAFAEAGYHKQIVNRLLEPFQIMKTVMTTTNLNNFIHLRNHKDAQPEIKELAQCMMQAMIHNRPTRLRYGDWHLPYVQEDMDLDTALKVSASCCAQVSYRTTNQSIEVAEKIYDKLVNSVPVHASPFEHQATPMERERGFAQRGVTHRDLHGHFWSGNFRGWIQHRQLIDGHHVEG